MIGVIIISENNAATEMLKTVQKVLGKNSLKNIKSLVIKSNYNTRTLKSKINKSIMQFKTHNGILLMTELYGSTQSNVCKDFLQKGFIEMITGYNLPMLIKVATLNQNSTLPQLILKLKDAGKKYIKSYKTS